MELCLYSSDIYTDWNTINAYSFWLYFAKNDAHNMLKANAEHKIKPLEFENDRPGPICK